MPEPESNSAFVKDVAARIANAPKGRDVFPAIRKAMGLPPFSPESLEKPLPPWTAEEAAEFTRIIEEMFEREP